jgi:hypothetical protein
MQRFRLLRGTWWTGALIAPGELGWWQGVCRRGWASVHVVTLGLGHPVAVALVVARIFAITT